MKKLLLFSSILSEEFLLSSFTLIPGMVTFVLDSSIFSASAIYFLEHDAQPEIFSSITASIWWATVSLATVGYGDIVPITLWGKVFASIISLIGIGVVAIPTGIISASFVTEIFNSKEEK